MGVAHREWDDALVADREWGLAHRAGSATRWSRIAKGVALVAHCARSATRRSRIANGRRASRMGRRAGRGSRMGLGASRWVGDALVAHRERGRTGRALR